LVYKGELIGLEYMWTEDMMQHLSIPTPEGTEELDALVPLPVGVKVDHVDTIGDKSMRVRIPRCELK
jgi:hypothetical protein